MISRIRKVFPILAITSMFLITTSSSLRALPNEALFNVTAEIIAQLTISETFDLTIGKFAVQAVNGTITVANTGNSRAATGDAGAILLMDGNTGVQNAEFAVTGEAGKTYSITVLGDGLNQAVLKTGAGTPPNQTMTFTFSVDGGLSTRTLDGLGAGTISIGGVLSDISDTQDEGVYTVADVPITIEYD